MRLAVDRMLSEGLLLELPRADGPPDRLELERGAGVRGVYASDKETIHLEQIGADELDAAKIVYHLGASSRFTAAPLALGGAEIDARIARGVLRGRPRFAGRFVAREAQGRSVAFDGGASHVAAASFEASGVAWASGGHDPAELRLDRLGAGALSIALKDVRVELEGVEARGAALRLPESGLEAAVATVELRGGRARVGALDVSFESAALADVRVRRGAAGLDLAASSVELRSLELSTGATTVRVDRARATSGARLEGGALTVGALTLDELSVDAPLPEAAPQSGRRAAPGPLDLSFLDHLFGRVAVDVHVDAHVPVIKRRVAVHRFRVPVDAGTIDFHELERDLAFLEDAILDFKVKGDRLVLQKDIPLIPFDEKTIVYFQLEDDEIALAKRNVVRLRRLFRPKLPEELAQPGETRLAIVKLDLDPIDAQLRLDGPGALVHQGAALRLGARGRPAIGELRVRGAVRHRPAEPPHPGELRVDVRGLSVALERLPIRGRVLSAETVEVDAIADGHVTFAGVRPCALRGTVRGAAITKLRFGPAA